MASYSKCQIFPIVDPPRDTYSDFLKNGYITGISVLNKLELEGVRSNFRDLEFENGEEKCQYGLHNIHMKYPWVMQLCRHPKLLEPIKTILGNDVILLDSRFICKYPNGTFDKRSYVAWHQDAKYWGIDGDVISAWLAVDSTNEDNGCLHVISGSHTHGLLEHRQSPMEGNMLSSNQEIPPDLFDASVVHSCPLPAGSMSIHHGCLIHGSLPNKSKTRRCGFVIRFVATLSKLVNDPKRVRQFEHAFLISGIDEYKHFENTKQE